MGNQIIRVEPKTPYKETRVTIYQNLVLLETLVNYGDYEKIITKEYYKFNKIKIQYENSEPVSIEVYLPRNEIKHIPKDTNKSEIAMIEIDEKL